MTDRERQIENLVERVVAAAAVTGPKAPDAACVAEAIEILDEVAEEARAQLDAASALVDQLEDVLMLLETAHASDRLPLGPLDSIPTEES